MKQKCWSGKKIGPCFLDLSTVESTQRQIWVVKVPPPIYVRKIRGLRPWSAKLRYQLNCFPSANTPLPYVHWCLFFLLIYWLYCKRKKDARRWPLKVSQKSALSAKVNLTRKWQILHLASSPLRKGQKRWFSSWHCIHMGGGGGRKGEVKALSLTFVELFQE